MLAGPGVSAGQTGAGELARTTQEEATGLRLLEGERLDALLVNIWKQAAGGQLEAVTVALKILDQRARLFGLYAPAKVAPANPEGTEAWQPEQAPESFYDDVLQILAEHGGLNGTPPADR